MSCSAPRICPDSTLPDMLTYILLLRRAAALEPAMLAPVFDIPEANIARSFRSLFLMEDAVISDSDFFFDDIGRRRLFLWEKVVYETGWMCSVVSQFKNQAQKNRHSPDDNFISLEFLTTAKTRTCCTKQKEHTHTSKVSSSQLSTRRRLFTFTRFKMRCKQK